MGEPPTPYNQTYAIAGFLARVFWHFQMFPQIPISASKRFPKLRSESHTVRRRVWNHRCLDQGFSESSPMGPQIQKSAVRNFSTLMGEPLAVHRRVCHRICAGPCFRGGFSWFRRFRKVDLEMPKINERITPPGNAPLLLHGMLET